MSISEILIEKTLIEYSHRFADHTGYFCLSRDVFSSRLDSFIRKTVKYLEGAIIGEIGNNTFDHNFNYSDDVPRGVYFNNENADMVILADFGDGIRMTLGRVVQPLSSDEEALEMAFTKIISGRSPEQRGNGLKFVRSSILENGWSLYFQSGSGCCRMCEGVASFTTGLTVVSGCLAMIKFGNPVVE